MWLGAIQTTVFSRVLFLKLKLFRRIDIRSFSPANLPAEVVSILYNRTDGAQGDYRTLRMELVLPPARCMPLPQRTLLRPAPAHRQQEITAICVPGNSAKSTVSKTARFIAAFMPQGETTEIIFHYPSFVHADGSSLYPIDVGYVAKELFLYLKIFIITSLAGACFPWSIKTIDAERVTNLFRHLIFYCFSVN